MDRYQRVEKPRPETAINENEIRITTQGLIRNYISYATSLLHEKQVGEIVLKAMGQAISKTVAIAEITKERIPGLHQDTSISSTSITDVWEPIEEGLVPLEMTRHVSMISISLSTRDLNKSSPGYQAPPSRVVLPRPQYRLRQHQPKQAQPPMFVANADSYGRGRGRGRGRERGWGRGRYGNNQGYGNNHGYGGNQGYGNNQRFENYQENGGWNWNWGRGGGGRGRGWGYRGAGYERGRGGGGGRGYGRGRGRMGGRGRSNLG